MVWHQFRQSLRALRQAPSLAAMIVLTLSMGIGSSLVLLAVVNAVLLKPLPYDEPESLALVWNELGKGAQNLPLSSPPDFLDYRQRCRLFEGFAAGCGAEYLGVSGILGTEGDVERVQVAAVSADFFPLLRVDPLLGRNFASVEEAVGGPQVVVLSHRLWTRRYGSDRSLLEKSIRLDGRPHRVIGVLPPGFRPLLPPEALFPRDPDLWIPLQIEYGPRYPRNGTFLTVLGRLNPGVAFPQADAEMKRLAEALRREHPEHQAADLRIQAVPLEKDVVKSVRPALLALMAAVGLVLLISCANAAHLLLARLRVRRKELAIRAALGASRFRLINGLMIENLIMTGAATLLGLLLARGTLSVFENTVEALPTRAPVAIDSLVAVFAAGLALATALLFGLVPAWRRSRPDLASTLCGGVRATTDTSESRLRDGLIAAEVLMSSILLSVATLLLSHLWALDRIRPGFDSEGVVTFQLGLPLSRYSRPSVRFDFQERLESTLRELPGVSAVGSISQMPFSGVGPTSPYAYDEETARSWESALADVRLVTDGFFQAGGIRLLAGRLVDDRDSSHGPPTVIVDLNLVRRAWPEEDPIGRRLQLTQSGEPEGLAEVVGVVEHVRNHELTRDVREQIYYSFRRMPPRDMAVWMRSTTDLSTLSAAVQTSVKSLDPGLPHVAVKPLSMQVLEASRPLRIALRLMGVFGAMALLLSTIGICGVVSYRVGLKTREFGIRAALGESRTRLLRRAVAGTMRPILLGVVVGLGLSVVLKSLFLNWLGGDESLGAAAVPALAALLAVIGLSACQLSARRALRLNLIEAIRE